VRTHDTKCHQLLVLSCPLSFAFFPFITSSKKGRCHAPPYKACYACTQHGMTSTDSHLWHKAKGGRKMGRSTHDEGHHHMHCDPFLIALLLESAHFEFEERGRSADRVLVHPAQPLACIRFQKIGATAT
jgi:hypothetical protein